VKAQISNTLPCYFWSRQAGTILFLRDGRLLVRGLVKRGPAFEAGVRLGDAVIEVAGAPVGVLADFLRRVWALGRAGVSVPLTVSRGGASVALTVVSGDRDDYLRKPPLQ